MRKLKQLLKANAHSPARAPVRAKSGELDTLYLYDTIVGSDADAEWFGGISPMAFVNELNSMTSPVIHLRINSPGGDVFGGKAIETAIRAHPAKVIGHVDGLAASAASVVAMACDELEVSQGAMVMIHNAWTVALGNANDLISVAALLEKIDGTLADTYAAKAGGESAEWKSRMEKETWFTAQEAVEVGLADRVFEQVVSAAWDVSAYDNAPASPSAEATKNSGERERYERISRIHTTKRNADFRAA